MTRFLGVFNHINRKNVKITAMSKIKQSVFSFIALGLTGLLIYSLTQEPNAPDVTFVTLDGNKIQMTDLRNKVVLINFWATDCSSCIKEMPELVDTYRKYRAKGFEVVAVAMPYDPPAQVVNYQKEKDIPFPIMHDGFGEISGKFGDVDATPTTFIYDKNGKRIQHITGKLDFSRLHAILDKELG